MKSRLLTDFLREIGRNKGRFISMFLIVLLGAAFFSGIRSTEYDMQRTADRFFDEHALMDFRVISTLGLTEEDLEDIRQTEGVKSVTGGRTAEALTTFEGKEYAARMIAVTEGVNEIYIKEGRLPETETECIVDDMVLEEYGLSLGDTIPFYAEEGDLEDSLSETEYTIVGTGILPYYIDFSRGSGSIGNGTIHFWVGLQESVFLQDVYTEAYVRMADAEELNAYGEKYEELADQLERRLKQVGIVACERRYSHLVAELEDAKAELEDAETQLSDTAQQIADGKIQIEDAEILLQEMEADLEAGRREYQNGLAELAFGRQQYTDGLAAYTEGYTQYMDGLMQYREGLAEYQEGYQQYTEALPEYTAALSQYEDGLMQYNLGMTLYQAAYTGLQTGETTYQMMEAQLETLRMQVAAGTLDASVLAAAEQRLAEYRRDLDEQRAELTAQKTQLDAAKAQLDQFTAMKAQMEATQMQLDSSYQILALSKMQLDTSGEQLELTKKQLDDAKEEIEAGELELEAAKLQIEEGEVSLEEAWEELEKKKQELQDGESEYEDALEEAEPELEDAKEEIKDAEEQLKNIETPEWYVLGRDMISSVANYGSDAERIGKLGVVFPVIFFMVAALVSLTAMTRMIEEQRMQIGTLKALGYSDKVIAFKYLGYALSATIIGGVIGCFLGEKSIPWVIMMAYRILYVGMPYVDLPINWDQAAMAVILSVLFVSLATVIACGKELRSRPAQLMRSEPPRSGKRVLLERIHFIWRHLSFNYKTTIRNLFRYKKRFFMTIAGIGGCMALLLVGFGLQDSITEVAKRQFVEIFTNDVTVVFDTTADDKEIHALQEKIAGYYGVESQMNVYFQSVDLETPGHIRNAYLYVPEDLSMVKDYLTLQDRESGEVYTYPTYGVALAEKTAKMLDVEVGDSITIKNGDEKAVQVEVERIVENYVEHYAFLSVDVYRDLYGSRPKYNQIYVNYQIGDADGEAYEDGLATMLMDQEACMGVSMTSAMDDQIDDMLGSLDMVIWVLIGCAGALAFVVLYNLNNINITERRRELATLKVLGFHDLETASSVYRENLILTVFGILIGVLLGTALHRYTIQTVEVEMMMFGREISLRSYILSGVIAMGFAVVVNIMMYFKIKEINMIESLKSVE